MYGFLDKVPDQLDGIAATNPWWVLVGNGEGISEASESVGLIRPATCLEPTSIAGIRDVDWVDVDSLC